MVDRTAPRDHGDAALVASVLRRRPSALFVDIDGTISPLVASPHDAAVLPGCHQSLREIARWVDVLCVLTGRPADQAWRMLRVDEALYVGNHGAETWFRGELLRPPGIERYHARLARAQSMLRMSLAHVPGLVFEDKGIGFAVHYRSEIGAGPQVLATAHRLATSRGLEVFHRSAHVEVRAPVAGNKGSAFLSVARRHAIRDLVVIGDDLVDVSAFDAAREHADGAAGRAIIVVVGESLPDEEADVRLRGPHETCALLSSVAMELAS